MGSQLDTSFLSLPGRRMGQHDCVCPMGCEPNWGPHLAGLDRGNDVHLCWDMTAIRTSWKPSVEDGRVGASKGSPIPDCNARSKSLVSSLSCPVWVLLPELSLPAARPIQKWVHLNHLEWNQRDRWTQWRDEVRGGPRTLTPGTSGREAALQVYLHIVLMPTHLGALFLIGPDHTFGVSGASYEKIHFRTIALDTDIIQGEKALVTGVSESPE